MNIPTWLTRVAHGGSADYWDLPAIIKSAGGDCSADFEAALAINWQSGLKDDALEFATRVWLTSAICTIDEEALLPVLWALFVHWVFDQVADMDPLEIDPTVGAHIIWQTYNLLSCAHWLTVHNSFPMPSQCQN